MAYEVKLEQFNGPLDKLLSLIEERQIEITQVSLADVTADFISYVEKLEQGSATPDLLADFIVVAARLLLIKSKVLLPELQLTQEEEADTHDLEHRLKIYREFAARGGVAGTVNASQHLAKLWNKNMIAGSRPLFFSLGEQSFFYPPKGVTTDHLRAAMQSLATLLQGLLPETKKIKITVVTLQEKIEELTKRFSEAASDSFKGISQKKNRNEVIVLFLAVLHMLANRLLTAEQSNTFSDIVLKKSDGKEGSNNFALGVPGAAD